MNNPKTIKCKEPGCTNEFQWNGYGIKPPRCRDCENARKSKKQKEYVVTAQQNRIEKNKKLLAQSTFNNNGGRNSISSGKYTNRRNNGSKRAKTPRQKAMSNADRWFSYYIRIKYAYKIQDGEVFCQCIIEPNVIKHAKYFDNGHCHSRENKATRYEEDNCRPQNRSSNRYKGESHHYIFIDNLTAEIGQDRYDRIDKLRRELVDDNEQFYLDHANKYRILTNKLVKELEITKWW